MKKLGILVVIALIMMFGCSKEEMTNTEQELFSVENNKQPNIGAKRGDGGANGWNFVEFYGTSRMVKDSILTICLTDSITGLSMDCCRKLLKLGNFSGNLPGYGKINSSLSFYTINFVDKNNPSEYFTLYGDEEYYDLFNDKSYTDRIEPYFYNIVISGTVALTVNDSFKFTITGELYPMEPLYDINTGIIKGSGFIGTERVISERKGKFKNYTQTFYNCGSTLIDGTNFQGVNLETGEMSLYVNNIHF